MELVSHDTVALPADLQSRIEAANNQITLLGSEIKRLAALQKKFEKDIDDLVLKYGTLDDLFSSRTLQVNTLKDQAATLADDVKEKHTLLEALKSEGLEIEKRKSEFDKAIQTERILLDKEKEGLIQQKSAYAIREKEIENRVSALAAREKKITDFVNDL